MRGDLGGGQSGDIFGGGPLKKSPWKCSTGHCPFFVLCGAGVSKTRFHRINTESDSESVQDRTKNFFPRSREYR